MGHKITRSKKPQKMGVVLQKFTMGDSKKTYLKNGLPGALHLDVLFQTKKKERVQHELPIWNLVCAIEKPDFEKKRKTFSILSEKAIFFNGNRQKFWAKKRYLIKSYSVSERAKRGLSSYTFISILKFLAKIDFF